MMWNFSSASWFWPLCVVTGLVLLSLGLMVFSRWFLNRVEHDSKLRHRDKALNLARERFATGQITSERFETLKHALEP